MTGYGFTGPQTSRGTVFDAKTESVLIARGGGYAGWQAAVIATLLVLWFAVANS